MATIAVVTSSPPFAEGGHLVMARELVRALPRSGASHRSGRDATESIWPADERLSGGVAHRRASGARGAHGRSGDQPAVSRLRGPPSASRAVAESPAREYYDLWDDFRSRLSWKNRIKEGVRRAAVHRVDHYLLTRLQRRFVISGTVQTRLHRFGGIQSDVLYPPPPKRDYRCDAYDDYLFAVSRLSPLKRFDLILRALAEPAAAGIKCVIGGEGAEMAAAAQVAAAARPRTPRRVRRSSRRSGFAAPSVTLPGRRLSAVQRRLWLRHG